ncbi:uncharacterized oxidoreductase YjmC-like isoform X2 [Littorina saxatilis]|uniref:uncharacterized oxidoreductase YjmC-like isoform X2 n=1 Tax=Littorina saxatilis TaxID=31220 RepID=UPI0038B5A0B3
MADSTSPSKQGGSDNSDNIIIARDELHAFCVRCLEKVGAAPSHACALADLLVAADYRGHFSHGLNRLEFYIEDLLLSMVASVGTEPQVVKETAATALVDGHNLLGPVVGKFSMDLAIQKAKESGIGWVSVRGSNHFGIAGWYSMRALDQGLMGMAFTNTSPKLVPTRAQRQTLGTNPISVAAPANNGDSMVLDMATTVVALGKVEVKKTLREDIPLGWGVDSDGKPTTDPDKVLVDGGLMPLGGLEETSGYKGYGLGMMVEIFCGILSGSAYGHRIRNWSLHDGCADLAEGETEVLVPGDTERQHMATCERQGGIAYKPKQVEWADNLAKKHGVKPPVRLA